MHFLVGILLGLLFENAGVDGGKTLNNIGFCIVTLVYLSYTSIMPAILKCKFDLQRYYILNSKYVSVKYLFCNFFFFFILTFIVPSELHILRKELFNNWYKLPTYYVAFLITNMPMQVRKKPSSLRH